MKNANNKIGIKSLICGFTLVELLVVVAIIGIIVGIVMGNINTAKQKANDARRMSDIKSIQNALGLYQTGKGQYPFMMDGYITGTDILSQSLVSELVVKTMPMDPINKDIGVLPYKYHYKSVDGSDYVLGFCLETNTISSHSKGCGNELKP